MIETIIMVGVITWFYRTARESGRNGIVWAVMGASSYYVPGFLCRQFLFPALLGPVLPYENRVDRQVVYLAAGIAVGFTCCVLFRRWLNAKAEEFFEANPSSPAWISKLHDESIHAMRLIVGGLYRRGKLEKATYEDYMGDLDKGIVGENNVSREILSKYRKPNGRINLEAVTAEWGQ